MTNQQMQNLKTFYKVKSIWHFFIQTEGLRTLKKTIHIQKIYIGLVSLIQIIQICTKKTDFGNIFARVFSEQFVYL